MSIQYSSLLYWFDYGDFETTVTWQNSKMSEYHIVLSSGGTVVYTFDFETSDTQTTVDMTMMPYFASHFVYVKGQNGYATLDAEHAPGTANSGDYHARVDITSDIPDFVYSDALLEAIEDSKSRATAEIAIRQKYAGKFDPPEDCQNYYFVLHDEEYDLYVLFAHAGNNKYSIIQVTDKKYSENSDYCVVSADLTNMTLAVIQHCNAEIIAPALAERYAGVYTVEPEGEYNAILVYDEEYETYAIFGNEGDGWMYYGHIKTVTEEILSMVSLATINTTTKVITVI